jgi:hypothetical protein
LILFQPIDACLHLTQVEEIFALFAMFKEIVNLQFVKIDIIVTRIAMTFVVVIVPSASADGAVMAIVIIFACPIVIEVGVGVLNANILTSGEERKEN